MNRKRPARTALIIGMRARKVVERFVEILAPQVQYIIAVSLSSETADPARASSPPRARTPWKRKSRATSNKQSATLAGQRILICGSLLLAGEALEDAASQTSFSSLDDLSISAWR